jgi:pimeloyl-ACP methyl ester carboxylesterase
VSLPRAASFAAVLALAALSPPRGALAADPKPRPVDPKAGGDAIHEGKAADGLAFQWRAPKRYDPEKGCGLTLILHGSNLDRRWGFANHQDEDKGLFRPDDLVVSPDGTTPNGKGGFNSLGEAKDAKRLHALLEELKKSVKVRGTYLYGHSQGSFFALYYAGEYPGDVDGVVAHASGVWNWTKLGKHGHGLAICLTHGTQDPVVPYVQSVGGLDALREAGYPIARLKPLEGWNHWPAEHNAAGGTPHTSQSLAWAEGMTTEDADRLEACLALLCDVKDKTEHDWAGLYAVAKRAEDAPFADAATKARASKAVAVVEALAERHAKALPEKPGAEEGGAPWVAHLPLFLRQFAGVPAADALAERWKDAYASHKDKGIARLKRHYAQREKDVAEAFEQGVAAVAEGFLWCEVEDRAFRERLVGWQKDAKKHRLSKAALKAYAVVPAFETSWKKGWEAFADVNKSAGDV